MSARSRRLILTSEARSDLRDILNYSERNWGAGQRREYEQLTARALDALVDFPRLGRPRPDLGPSLLSFPVRQHVIIYEATAREVRVVRILHARRDAADEFKVGDN